MGCLVVIKREQNRDAWINDLNASGVPWSDFTSLPRFFRVDCRSDKFPLARHPGVDLIEPDDLPVQGAAQSISIAADFSGGSWGIARAIRRAAPWYTGHLKFPQDTYYRSERDGTGVDIYFLDSGIRTGHDEFGGRASNISGAFTDTSGTGDDFGHGTQVSSGVAGATVGIARGATLFCSKMLNSSGSGTNSHFVTSADAALAHYLGRTAPAVVNMSLLIPGGVTDSAVADLIDAGMVVVACAGNDGNDLGASDMYPAESDVDVVVVSGTGPADIPYYGSANRSNWGTRIDVSAPSQVCYLATNTGDSDYIVVNGTSFGCAYTSGVIACMLQGHNRLSGVDAAARRAKVQAVKTKLMSNATTGKIVNPGGWGITLPDRLLYLDPDQAAPETISGL